MTWHYLDQRINQVTASPSGGTAIFARSSFRRLGSFCYGPANWAKHSFGRWLEAAAKRMHHNVVATAPANKLTRIAWSVLYHGRSYEPRISAELA